MTAVLRRVERWRGHAALGQLVRFGIAGLLSTLIYSAVYLPLATYALPRRLAVGPEVVESTRPAVLAFSASLGKWRNGRRARFRSVCPKGRGGSTPLSRTTMYGPLTTSNPL